MVLFLLLIIAAIALGITGAVVRGPVLPADHRRGPHPDRPPLARHPAQHKRRRPGR
jgi:hypothetical protein